MQVNAPFLCQKVVSIDFPSRTKSVSACRCFRRSGTINPVKKSLLAGVLMKTMKCPTCGGPMKRNNRIEGGVNSQLRAVLRNHRGLSLVRRAKAVCWWCYMHTECPLPAAEIARSMPTDADIDLLYELH